MAARLIDVPRPEGGAEHGVVWTVHHKCSPARALYADMGPDIDLVQFAVGLHGWEMPLFTPFVVEASNACDACGAQLSAWFQWTGARIILPNG